MQYTALVMTTKFTLANNTKKRNMHQKRLNMSELAAVKTIAKKNSQKRSRNQEWASVPTAHIMNVYVRAYFSVYYYTKCVL